MPNISTRNSTKCGNDKCGTFAPVPMKPHHGGKPMMGSGGSVTGNRNMAKNQSTRGGGMKKCC